MKKLSELKLIEQAYLAGYNEAMERNEYQAVAVDKAGNSYLLL